MEPIGFPTFRYHHALAPTGCNVRFGDPFRFNSFGQRAGREMLRQMTDEAMYILAAMLPEYRRGFYSDLSLPRKRPLSRYNLTIR